MARPRTSTAAPKAQRTQRTQEPERISSTVRKGTKRRLRLWLLFICLFVGWSGYTFVSQMIKMQELEAERAVRAEEYDKAKLTRDNLQFEIDKLGTTEYILQIARSRGMKLPDELFIRKQGE